jgi:hypothetical protein
MLFHYIQEKRASEWKTLGATVTDRLFFPQLDTMKDMVIANFRHCEKNQASAKTHS